jgi:hypothetical protein
MGAAVLPFGAVAVGPFHACSAEAMRRITKEKKATKDSEAKDMRCIYLIIAYDVRGLARALG